MAPFLMNERMRVKPFNQSERPPGNLKFNRQQCDLLTVTCFRSTRRAFISMDFINDDNTKMYFYENRLLTFVGWPFEEGCGCTPENMAKAGFIHTPSENSPDIAQCFFCLKELEGWEPEDDPEKEHKSHSPTCNFITMKKTVENLTVEEFLKLEKERQKFAIAKKCKQAIDKFEEAVKLKRGHIIQTAMGEE